jgi:hypothetical protein
MSTGPFVHFPRGEEWIVEDLRRSRSHAQYILREREVADGTVIEAVDTIAARQIERFRFIHLSWKNYGGSTSNGNQNV